MKKVQGHLKRLLPAQICVLCVLVAVTAMLPAPASAIADPDTIPQVNAVYVYSFSDGSLGVLIDYYLDYGVTPNETATESFLAVFVNTDGATQVKAVAPYTFVDSGYGRGLIYIPFTAAEVATYSLDSADQALYRVWLVGNPTLSWDDGTPPKVVATIDQWTTTGDMEVLLALRVLYYADQLELIWSLDMVEATALGNRLTTVGQSYFENVIPDLRTLAPAAFSNSSYTPSVDNYDYTTSFGAIVTGATVVGSPQVLAQGTNTVTTNGTGTIVITLNYGTTGNITNGVAGIVSSSPSDLVSGENHVTVTTLGDLVVYVRLNTPQQSIVDETEGTGFDLTNVAAKFGMSRTMFSSLVWILLTILIVGAAYAGVHKNAPEGSSGAGGVAMLILALSLIGGGMLGLLDLRVLAMLAIGYAGFIGYILFFRNSGGDIGKVVMFMGWMMFMTSLVGGILTGAVVHSSTYLTADVAIGDDTITVQSTSGFPGEGIIVIDDERIAYTHKTTDTFTDTFWRSMSRGVGATDEAAHTANTTVRQVESAVLNNSLDFNIAQITDAAGIMAFVTVPLALFDLLKDFVSLPIAFLGTDMVLLTYVWGLFALGLIVSLLIAMTGGRRV